MNDRAKQLIVVLMTNFFMVGGMYAYTQTIYNRTSGRVRVTVKYALCGDLQRDVGSHQSISINNGLCCATIFSVEGMTAPIFGSKRSFTAANGNFAPVCADVGIILDQDARGNITYSFQHGSDQVDMNARPSTNGNNVVGYRAGNTMIGTRAR